MTEWVSAKRQTKGVMVTVTQQEGHNTASAKELVLGASKVNIKNAVVAARKTCAEYMAGIEAAE